ERNSVANTPASEDAPVRNDLLFNRFRGRVIRNITIKRLDFGTPITDTSQSLKSTLTKWANDVHHKTREEVIRNNLFFKKGDKLVALLSADSVVHLADMSWFY